MNKSMVNNRRQAINKVIMEHVSVLRYLILCITVGIGLETNAQYKLLSTNRAMTDTEPVAIQLKWFGSTLDYTQAFHVYRQEQGKLQWEKITDQPIKKLDSISSALRNSNDDLMLLEHVVNDYQSKNEPVPGLMLINIYVMAFTNNEYARFLGLFFEDNTVERGKTYKYKVVALQGNSENLVGLTQEITAGTFVPDTPVTVTRAKQIDDKVELSWTIEEEKFFAINIYRKDVQTNVNVKLNDFPVLISKVPNEAGEEVYPEIMYKDDSLTRGQQYEYVLRGVNYFNQELASSAAQKIIFADYIPPVAPRKLQVEVDTLHLTLTWRNNHDQENYPKGLNLYLRQQTTTPWEKFADVAPEAVRYEHEVAEPGPYYFMISAYNEFGFESESKIVFREVEDVVAPIAPQGLVIESDTGMLMLSWQANPEQDVMGYGIYRTTDHNDLERYVLVNPEPIKGTSYKEELPKNVKNKFYYKLVALDTALNKSGYSSFGAGQMPDVLSPAVPIIKRLTYPGNDQIMIEWVANVDPDLLGYSVFKFEGDDIANAKPVRGELFTASTNTYTDQKVLPNTTYRYFIKAQDSVGNTSPRSNVVDGLLYQKVNNLTDPVLSHKLKKKQKTVELKWTSAGKDAIGYIVYQKNEKGHDKAVTGLIAAQTKTLTGLQTGNMQYFVRAFDDQGNKTNSPIITIKIADKK